MVSPTAMVSPAPMFSPAAMFSHAEMVSHAERWSVTVSHMRMRSCLRFKVHLISRALRSNVRVSRSAHDVPIIGERASRTRHLQGVTQLKIGEVCLSVCMDVRKACLYFDPHVFVLVRWSTPSQTSLNRILCLSISTRITLEIVLFTVLNSFTGPVKT